MMLKEDSYYSSRNDSSLQIYACGKNRFCQLGFELIKGKDDAKSNSSNQEVTQFTPIPFFEMKKNLLHRYNHGIVTSSPPHLMSSSTNHNHIIHSSSPYALQIRKIVGSSISTFFLGTRGELVACGCNLRERVREE